MIFKGLKFRRAKNVVFLPNRDADGKLMPYVRPANEHCVHFGKTVPHANDTRRKQPDAKAVIYNTDFRWEDSSDVVQATLIPDEGWSLTNMMYGKDGRIYLMLDGRFYTHKRATKIR